jgi:hypothetical protein
MQLRSGNVPDVVVFYTIADDIYSGYQSGRAGGLENFAQLAARFDGPQQPSAPPTFVERLSSALKNTNAYGLVDFLMGKLTIANPQQGTPTPIKLVTYESMGIDAAALSDAIAQDYLGNYKIVSALAQEYGFKYFFFLPPSVSLSGKPLTSEEQEMKRLAEGETAHLKLFTAVYRTLESESSKYQNLHSMVHVFDRYDSLMFIDEGHVTPIGNQVIAERMLDVILERSSAEK